MYNDKQLKEELQRLSFKHNVPIDVIYFIYKTPYEFIKNTIDNFDKFGDITEEDFNNLRVSFNIPSIGKLYTNWDIINKKRNIYNKWQKK